MPLRAFAMLRHAALPLSLRCSLPPYILLRLQLIILITLDVLIRRSFSLFFASHMLITSALFALDTLLIIFAAAPL